ncbi:MULTISPECIES: CPBP family intramembrane glutamic endopeptidase [unclassified Sphingomonas]|uniref:CPBP family intramembrane glutamic endopeptidase n=1 Tax=unclassified Sphingomonas TaxID=196159 RepID=UPI00082B1E30|nr:MULTISPECIES: CPBP family intramembrane glutamic endopeptidase [unclassified Sphingomonas]
MPADSASPGIEAAVTLVVAIVAAAGVVIGAQAAYAGLAAGLEGISPAVQEGVFTLLLFGVLAAIAWGAMALRPDPGRQLIGTQPGRMAASGVILGVGGVMLAIGLSWLAGAVMAGGSDAGGAAVLAGTGVILIQASAEEFYFRGWLQPVLQRGWGDAAGLVATSIAFALLHLAGGGASATGIVNLLIGGLWFGVLADRSGGIVLPALAHFGWNWGEAIIAGLSPNPGVGSFGALVDLDLIGVARWGGSDEGLNASIGMTFVLVALLVATLGWRRPGRRATDAVTAP